MFRIGAFARLTGVTAKRLRHYHRMGLFTPAWVDPETGYRSYTATQIPELRRIVSLIQLGIPLSRIRDLQDSGVPLEAELNRRRAELERERQALDHRLAALDIRLEATETLDVVVRDRSPGRWASLRAEVEPGEDLAPLFVELEEYVARFDARAALPPVCVVHGASTRPKSIELLVPVDRRIEPGERIVEVPTPRRQVASTMVVGGYDNLAAATQQLRQWAQATKYTPSETVWYVYLRFGAEDHLDLPDGYVTTRRSELVTEVLLELDEPRLPVRGKTRKGS